MQKDEERLTPENVLRIKIQAGHLRSMGICTDGLQERLQAHLDAMTPAERTALGMEVLRANYRRWESN
jgi:hypothetical protein